MKCANDKVGNALLSYSEKQLEMYILLSIVSNTII